MESAVVVADTGFVVALLNRSDIKHIEPEPLILICP